MSSWSWVKLCDKGKVQNSMRVMRGVDTNLRKDFSWKGWLARDLKHEQALVRGRDGRLFQAEASRWGRRVDHGKWEDLENSRTSGGKGIPWDSSGDVTRLGGVLLATPRRFVFILRPREALVCVYYCNEFSALVGMMYSAFNCLSVLPRPFPILPPPGVFLWIGKLLGEGELGMAGVKQIDN